MKRCVPFFLQYPQKGTVKGARPDIVIQIDFLVPDRIKPTFSLGPSEGKVFYERSP